MKLTEAIILAAQAHDGQTDKSGQPYIFHVLRVGMMGQTEDEQVVGVLHDVIEDCKDEFACDLCDKTTWLQFGALHRLSRLGLDSREEKPEDLYYRSVRNHPLSLAVKLNDIRDNLNETRLAALAMATQDRLREKYAKALSALGVLK